MTTAEFLESDGKDGDTGATADDDEPERGPLRRCAVTRERLPKERMIRFVIGPDRTVVPDLAARLPGRGIWLSARGDVVETACTRGTFAKAARGVVGVPPDLRSGLQAALSRRLVDYLGLARRAGQAVAGFAKAREWLSSGRAALVIQAGDGSAEERQRFLGGWDGPVVTVLDGDRLGAVFGRERAVHVAVAAGRLAETLRHEAERLAGLAEVASGQGPGSEPKRAGPKLGRSGVRRQGTNSPSGAAGRNDVQDTGG
jgi:predicted RNA-binding protein YlxR (DUF448 family)